jgi:hypothetical protein
LRLYGLSVKIISPAAFRASDAAPADYIAVSRMAVFTFAPGVERKITGRLRFFA